MEVGEPGNHIELNIDGQRAHETVAKENAEEGADQGSRDLLAYFFDGSGDRRHRNDDAQHGGDDAETGHGIRRAGQDVDGGVGFVFHALDIHMKQLPQLLGLDTAINDGAQCAAQELDGRFVSEHVRVALEDGACGRVGEMLLQRDQAVAPAEQEQLVERHEKRVIGLSVVGRALEGAKSLADKIHEDLLGRHHNHGAQGRAANDDQFRKVHQGAEVAAGHDETAGHRGKNYDCAQQDDHAGSPAPYCIATASCRSMCERMARMACE